MLRQSELAFSGAGTLGSLEVGADSELWQHTRPSALVGTSAGSIVAGLLALGHSPSSLYDIVISADYSRLIPMRPWLAPFRGYLASNRNVIAWLREITSNQTMADCEIPFTAICSDLNTGKARTWDSWLLPDMPVWEAILCSMSIPGVYPAWEGRYQDGGMCDNLGINYLPGKHKRLGLKVTESTTIGPVRGIIDQAQRDISMMLSAGEQDMVLLAKATGIPIIRLPAGNLGFLDTSMTRAQKIGLYAAGQAAVHKWMATPEGTAWLRLP
ncbi:MAG: patatin-like phospholipase family protein [Acidithiobacillus ferriphilus]